MIGIPLGVLYANVVESLFHRHVLHGLGRNPKSFWAFHLRDPQTKERLAIAVGVAAHLPLAPIAPFFVGTLAYCGYRFYRLHERGHLDPQWAREHLPWHYDHHMGPDPEKNWGIGLPIYDYVAGTRAPYAGTADEARATKAT
ncbi:MAG: hypothetical protein U0271_29400 [Polyangiaceae bacterium]